VGWVRGSRVSTSGNLVRYKLYADHLPFSSFTYHRLSATYPLLYLPLTPISLVAVDIRNAGYEGVDKRTAPDVVSENI
jgi:hypothetical protein